MEPLSKKEIKEYIEHHLKIANTHSIFTPGAIEATSSNTNEIVLKASEKAGV